ncbi:MAG: hypothetical protein H0X17_23300, partial [Deltaproteobacteria bacterium]|nr:hypothetical protein [Deltaproteobacteria bacterium]
ERAINSTEAGFLAGLEPVLGRAILLASYDVLAKDPDYFGKDLARRRAVTPEQIKAAAAKYLKPSARVTLTIRPGKKPAEKAPGKAPVKAPGPPAKPATAATPVKTSANTSAKTSAKEIK